MVLPMFIFLAISVFTTQLVFCFYAKKLWIKLLPVGAPLVLDVICWGIFFSGILSSVYGGDFAAYAYGIVLLGTVVTAGTAWSTYGLVKLLKRRKRLQ